MIKRLLRQISVQVVVMGSLGMTLVSTITHSWNVVAHSAHMLLFLCPDIYDVLVENQCFRSLLLGIILCLEFHLQKSIKINIRHQLHWKNLVFKKMFVAIFFSLLSKL